MKAHIELNPNLCYNIYCECFSEDYASTIRSGGKEVESHAITRCFFGGFYQERSNFDRRPAVFHHQGDLGKSLESTVKIAP